MAELSFLGKSCPALSSTDKKTLTMLLWLQTLTFHTSAYLPATLPPSTHLDKSSGHIWLVIDFISLCWSVLRVYNSNLIPSRVCPSAIHVCGWLAALKCEHQSRSKLYCMVNSLEDETLWHPSFFDWTFLQANIIPFDNQSQTKLFANLFLCDN